MKQRENRKEENELSGNFVPECLNGCSFSPGPVPLSSTRSEDAIETGGWQVVFPRHTRAAAALTHISCRTGPVKEVLPASGLYSLQRPLVFVTFRATKLLLSTNSTETCGLVRRCLSGTQQCGKCLSTGVSLSILVGDESKQITEFCAAGGQRGEPSNPVGLNFQIQFLPKTTREKPCSSSKECPVTRSQIMKP